MSCSYQIPYPKDDSSRLIPNQIAIIEDPIDVEALPFYISFEYYNDKLCEIQDLEKNGAKRVLHNLKTIGRCNYKTLKQNGIDILPVSNSGEYTEAFVKLPLDVDLKEHKISGTARIFYFIASRIFYIVCFKSSHFETSKHRH